MVRRLVAAFVPDDQTELPEDFRRALASLSDKRQKAVLREMNANYLAGLLDTKGVDARRVRLTFGSSRSDARDFFSRINVIFGVKGTIKVADLSKAPYFRKVSNRVKDPHKRPTTYYIISDPSDVIVVAKAAYPYSHRKERLDDVIAAAESRLERRRAKAP